MNKKKNGMLILIGIFSLNLFIEMGTAETEELFSIEGYTEYTNGVIDYGEWPQYVRLNISFPVKFQKDDRIYFEGTYEGECDGLTPIIFTKTGNWYPSNGWHFLSNDLCHPYRVWTVVSNPGDCIPIEACEYDYVILKASYEMNSNTIYKLTWRLWATRYIDPDEYSETIGIDNTLILLSFIGLATISILVYHKLKKRRN